MKVYELAKKLEVKSVFLMDKIRKDWKLPIKSHMEALTPEMVQQIEKKFYATQKPTKKKKTEKKVSTKKKVEKKASPIKKKSLTRKKVSVKKASLKEKIDASATQIEEKKEGQSPKANKKFIIRRKIDSEKISKEKEELVKNQSSSIQKEDLNSSINSPSSNNIRSDLVSVKVTDPLTDTFWDDKKEATEPLKKQIKKPIAEKDVSSKFNATDFRKREVIFQPRKKRTAQIGEFKSTKITTPKTHKRILNIHGEMKIEALYKKIGVKKQAFIRKLKEEGVDTKEIDTLDFETISLIVSLFWF